MKRPTRVHPGLYRVQGSDDGTGRPCIARQVRDPAIGPGGWQLQTASREPMSQHRTLHDAVDAAPDA